MVKILSHQLNFTVGDIQGNYQKILQAYQKSCQKNAQLAVFSELAISGYPPQDLLLKQHFIDECLKAINELSKATKDQDCAILVGAPNQTQDRFGNKHLENCAFYLKDGEVIDIISKKDLPNEKVFDEKRYFKAVGAGILRAARPYYYQSSSVIDKRAAIVLIWNMKFARVSSSVFFRNSATCGDSTCSFIAQIMSWCPQESLLISTAYILFGRRHRCFNPRTAPRLEFG